MNDIEAQHTLRLLLQPTQICDVFVKPTNRFLGIGGSLFLHEKRNPVSLEQSVISRQAKVLDGSVNFQLHFLPTEAAVSTAVAFLQMKHHWPPSAEHYQPTGEAPGWQADFVLRFLPAAGRRKLLPHSLKLACDFIFSLPTLDEIWIILKKTDLTTSAFFCKHEKRTGVGLVRGARGPIN
ncbi:unnamed protein product [Mesocestoides corti]|uniref:Uncharacterized protein n=1 Tax=Mesocestoides corti TaxID=53468 RepID=A0A0R3UJL2_MESCO|nr:unnamed protein product [Mesocestoides corti]